MDLRVSYLDMRLENPIIISSSPFTMSLDRLKKLEDKGAGAVVLKSVFEEQIMGEAGFLEHYNNYPEAADYLNNYVGQDYVDGHLNLIYDAKKALDIPVIASINCQSTGAWIDYAKAIESAGADALELNVFIQPKNTKQTAEKLEEEYKKIVFNVIKRLKIPVSVKLSMRFTNLLEVCREIYFRKGRGVVMFNRFFEPDIDIENIRLVSSDSISSNSELRNNLRYVGMCSPQLPMLDIAVSTGIHKGADVVKCLLTGAKATQICSALYISGLGVIEDMKTFLSEWMEHHGFESIDEFRGLLSYKDTTVNDDFYQRAQYMKYMPREKVR